jgi:hypothetical protein
VKKIDFIVTLTFLLFTGCAGGKIQAERVNSNSTVETILDDAMKIDSFDIYPSPISNEIKQFMSGSGPLGGKLEKIRALVCDGKHAKVDPTYTVHLVVPKPTSGTPVNEASERQENFLATARAYLKEFFYYSVGHEPHTYSRASFEETFKPDFEYNHDYYQYLRSFTKDHSSLRGDMSFAIPVAQSRSQTDMVKFYKELHYKLYSMRHQDDRPWEYLYSVISPKNRIAVLAPKALPFVGVGWEKYKMSPLIPQSGIAGHIQLNEFQRPLLRAESGSGVGLNLGSLSHRHNFVISEEAWRFEKVVDSEFHPSNVKSKALYPMHVGYADDLTNLYDNFTFVLPLDVIQKAFGIEKDDWLHLQHLGYDPEAEKFSAASAIHNRDTIWEKILSSQTSIKEAAQVDGTYLFELTYDNSLFCAYGPRLGDLQSGDEQSDEDE